MPPPAFSIVTNPQYNMDSLKNEGGDGDIAYKAVESREVTLCQLRDGLIEVIDLESNPPPMSVPSESNTNRCPWPGNAPAAHDPCPSKTTPSSLKTTVVQKRVRFAQMEDDPEDIQPIKKRKLSDIENLSINDPQKGLQRHDVDSSIPQNTPSLQRQKKPLWRSCNAQENMSRISGLPSPETLVSDTSIESKAEEPPNQNGLASYLQSTWSFENLEESIPVPDLHSSRFEPTTEPAYDLKGQPSSSYGRSRATVSDTIEKKKQDLIRQGIEESRRIRERTQREKERILSAEHMRTAHHGHGDFLRESNHARNRHGTQAEVDSISATSSLDPDEDPAVIEGLLDIAQAHGRSRTVSPTEAQNTKKGTRTPNRPLLRSNPLSREAAETWRTQDRHLSHTPNSNRNPSLTQTARHRQLSPSVQDKEGRVAELLQRSKWKNYVQLDREAGKRLLNTKFHGVDIESGPRKVKATAQIKTRPRSAIEVQNELHKLMGTPNLSPVDAHTNCDPHTEAQSTKEPELPPNDVSRPSLFRLNQLSTIAGKHQSLSKTPKAIPQEVFDSLPKNTDFDPEDVARTSRSALFEQFSKEQQDLFVERDLNKEKEKDLEIIRSVFTIGAQLGSLVPFDPEDSRTLRQLSDIRGFAEAVLNQEKSGRTLRAKIRSIRDFFKRRLEKDGQVPDDDAASKYLSILLKPDTYHKLVSETKRVADRLSLLTKECNRINVHYHSTRISRATASSNSSIHGKNTGSRTISSSRPLNAKQKLAQLRSTLNLFEKSSTGWDDETEVIDLGSSRADRDEGEVSEEDEGESFMRPPKLLTQHSAISATRNDPPPEGVQTRQQDQQAQVGTQLAFKEQTSQGTHQRLLGDMLARRQQQAHLAGQGAQQSDSQIAQNSPRRGTVRPMSSKDGVKIATRVSDVEDTETVTEYDIEEESSQEFDDTDLDIEDGDRESDDDEVEPHCKRYIVEGVCQGLSAEQDSSRYILGKCLDKKSARRKALHFATWVKEQISDNHRVFAIDSSRESITETKNSFEHKVTFGDDEKLSCRAWIEEEIYTPSQKAYDNAKVRKACESPEIWFVDSERTIEPYVEQNEDEDEDEDDGGVSSSKGDGPVLSANASVGEEVTSDESTSNSTASGSQIEGIDKTAGEISAQESPSNSNTDGHPESFTSSSDTLVTEANDSPKDVDMSNDDDVNKMNNPMTHDQNEDEDDLFGPDVPEAITIPTSGPASPPIELPFSHSALSPTSSASKSSQKPPRKEATITRTTGDQIRMFTTIAHANRHAKDVFMYWYIEQLPGLGNQGFIEVEDEAMEDELRAIGNQSCWSREEWFLQDRIDNVTGEKMKVKDTMRVWVRKGKCFGPSN